MNALNYIDWLMPGELRSIPRNGYAFFTKYVFGNAKNLFTTATAKVTLASLSVQKEDGVLKNEESRPLERIYKLRNIAISLRIWLQQQPQSFTDFYYPQMLQLYDVLIKSVYISSSKLCNILPLSVAYIHCAEQQRAICFPKVKIIELEDEVSTASEELHVPSENEEQDDPSDNENISEFSTTQDTSSVAIEEEADQHEEIDNDSQEEIKNYELRRTFCCSDLSAEEETEEGRMDWSLHNALFKFEANEHLYRKQLKLRFRRRSMRRLLSPEGFRTAPVILPLREVPLRLRTIQEEDEEEATGCSLMRALRRLRRRRRRHTATSAPARPRAPLWQRLLMGVCCVGVEDE